MASTKKEYFIYQDGTIVTTEMERGSDQDNRLGKTTWCALAQHKEIPGRLAWYCRSPVTNKMYMYDTIKGVWGVCEIGEIHHILKGRDEHLLLCFEACDEPYERSVLFKNKKHIFRVPSKPNWENLKGGTAPSVSRRLSAEALLESPDSLQKKTSRCQESNSGTNVRSLASWCTHDC